MSLIKMLKDKSSLVNENMKMRRNKLELETKLDQVDEIKLKYIKLLEQKSEQFDLYVAYQNQCLELNNEKKELKKQVAELNETNNTLTTNNEELIKQVEKLERKLQRMVKQNEKSK